MRRCAEAKNGFFCQLVDSVVDNFGGFYPELRASRDKVLTLLLQLALACHLQLAVSWSVLHGCKPTLLSF